jgi:hypothetical protein
VLLLVVLAERRWKKKSPTAPSVVCAWPSKCNLKVALFADFR